MIGRPVKIGLLSPLNNANAIAVKIFLKAQIKNLGRIIQAIEV